MDGAGIAAKVAFGYSKGGLIMGLPHALYRPTSPTLAALAPQNWMRALTFLSSATPGDAAFERPAKHGQPIRYGFFDTRVPPGMVPSAATQVGDYIQGSTGTYFIAAQRADEQPELVECDTVISISRPTASNAYSGRTPGSDVAIVTNWPASSIIGERTQAGRPDLPSDFPMKGALILLPTMAGLVVRTSDRIVDGLGHPFAVSSSELSPLGWRITATYVGT